MRGRLHHTFLAEIVMLDAIATRADVDGTGPQTVGGFDDDFDEIIVFTQNNVRVSGRKEQRSVLLPCNVDVAHFQVLQQLMAGNAPDSKFQVVAHRRAFESLGLMNDLTGEPLIRTSDRLIAIRDKCQNMVLSMAPGLYVVQVAPQFGIGTTPDLFVLSFEDREQFARA